jgi:hypothetical protein
MLLGEQDIDPVVCSRSLELEVETSTETLTQRKSPGLIDAAPKGCAQDEFMPPPSSKNRSAMIVVFDGTAPTTARPATMYPINCCAPERQILV